MPNLGSNMAVVDQQPEDDQFLADRSSDAANASLLRTDARPSAASTDAAPQSAPRRNWDRLTYGGFGGWFKRLLSSKKRAQHRREVQERRDAWAQSMESLNDGRSLPNLDLLKSKWAGKKLQSAEYELSRAAALYDADDERFTNPRRKLQRLMFLRDNVSAVHDEDVSPGPAAARRAPQTDKGILKASSPASTSGPVAGDAEFDAQLQASLSRSAGMDNAYQSQQAVHDRVKALRDGTGDDESYEQAHADYTAMTEPTYQMEKRRERQSGVQAWKAQGDLGFPIRDVDRKFAQASFKMSNRPSMSLMSRAQADLDPVTRQQLEAKGANYHRSRDEDRSRTQ